ncbi:hypothetical protein MAQ5080_00467 [Marinomonas aquimarina]|uniref:DUF3301 domain-containing protein n=1 Tax=Marinomonas aquimarina TaxID=295068 RepID=A0A1A8T460_9GAMM|nr:DUF3301 domain-containing protein [Marinomonas aquimarina]SBS26251.1 hypothetical protein MAQ5080_00467 [Marinomonas aquimarina]
MNLTLLDTTLIFVVFIFVLLIWQHFKVREFTLKRVKQQCAKMELQMLDDSIYGSFWCPTFANGQLKVRRRYRFYFTATGEGRYLGEIEMLGMQQTRIYFEPHAF